MIDPEKLEKLLDKHFFYASKKISKFICDHEKEIKIDNWHEASNSLRKKLFNEIKKGKKLEEAEEDVDSLKKLVVFMSKKDDEVVEAKIRALEK